MGKKQKKVKENQTIKQKKVNNGEAETQVVKFITKRKHVNERHKNGLYSDAELTQEDKQTDLYKEYIKVKYIPYCKQFLHNKKDLPQWGKTELKKLTEILQDKDRKKYDKNKRAINERNRTYYDNHKQERKNYFKDYRNANKEKINDYMKDYQNAHKEESNLRAKRYYKRVIENIKKIKDGQIDELSDQQLLSVQSVMKRFHNGKFKHNIHGFYLGDKDNNDIYDRNNLQKFKDFLKSQVGVETVSQIDFNEQIDFTKLDNMHFNFNEFSGEEDNIFNNSYFNNDIIPNENHQQDNNDQPINTQKEQTLDKYGFVTYGHKTNGTNDEELFALDHAYEFDGQSI